MNKLIKHLEHTRIVLIEKGKKNPFEPAWPLMEGLYERVEGGAWVNKKTGEFYKVKGEIYRRELTNYSFNDPKVQEHIANGGNIGFLCGSGRIYVFDLDKIELLKEFEKIIGETLTIETTHGYHLYFEYDEELYKTIFEKNGVHLGELQGIGTQVLIPPSIHPSGKPYSVFKDLPIVKITKDKLNLIKQKFTDERIFEVKSPDWNKFHSSTIGDQISITSLLDMSKLKKHGQEYYGSNPWHGSETGMNFWVNPLKNLAYCFRCQSGLDSLAVLAINKGILNCSDFSKDGKRLRGGDFKKIVEIAEKEYNLNLSQEKIYDPQFQIKVISAKELSEMNIPIPSWIVEGWIPEESLVVLAGKTGAMKSFLTTVMGLCSVYGREFLGKFATKKGVWLYIDQDNPLILTKDRNKKILLGLNVEAPEDFKYLCQNGIKLDIDEHVNMLEEIIKSYSPSVVVLDSLTRFLSSADENSSLDISNLFSKLRMLSSKYKTSFLIIHHTRKGSKNSQNEDNDERVRGSTDIVNSADCLLMISRKDKTSPYIQVKQEKNRYAREMEPFAVIINQNDNAVSFEITTIAVPEQDIESKSASVIFNWLSTEKVWPIPADKIFKTAEAIEKFPSAFNSNPERNRKIIQGALSSLVVDGKIQRSPTKGYYKFIDLINLEENN